MTQTSTVTTTQAEANVFYVCPHDCAQNDLILDVAQKQPCTRMPIVNGKGPCLRLDILDDLNIEEALRFPPDRKPEIYWQAQLQSDGSYVIRSSDQKDCSTNSFQALMTLKTGRKLGITTQKALDELGEFTIIPHLEGKVGYCQSLEFKSKEGDVTSAMIAGGAKAQFRVSFKFSHKCIPNKGLTAKEDICPAHTPPKSRGVKHGTGGWGKMPELPPPKVTSEKCEDWVRTRFPGMALRSIAAQRRSHATCHTLYVLT